MSWVLVIAALSAGCGSEGVLTPTPVAQTPVPIATPSPTPTPPPTPSFPAVTLPARMFGHPEPLSYPLTATTQASRFILYDNGGFALQFGGAFRGEYRGTYTEANGAITFNWEGWSAAGPWGATGTLTGDRLAVRYNLIMQLTDFEDAVYVRE